MAACLKSGLVVPVYKRGSRNPALTDSYRVITLTSVVSKVLESLVLERMMPIILEVAGSARLLTGKSPRNLFQSTHSVRCTGLIASFPGPPLARKKNGGK